MFNLIIGIALIGQGDAGEKPKFIIEHGKIIDFKINYDTGYFSIGVRLKDDVVRDWDVTRHMETDTGILLDWFERSILFEHIRVGDDIRLTKYLTNEQGYKVGLIEVLPRPKVTSFDFAMIQEEWVAQATPSASPEDFFSPKEIKLISNFDSPKGSVRQNTYDQLRRLPVFHAQRFIVHGPKISKRISVNHYLELLKKDVFLRREFVERVVGFVNRQ